MEIAPLAPTLRFTAVNASVSRAHAAPTIDLLVEIDAGDAAIRSIALNAEVRIAAQRRRYGEREQARLHELFGAPGDWARSLRPLRWLRTSMSMGAFCGKAQVAIPLSCSYDFDVAANNYLAALGDGEIPVDAIFNGTMYYLEADGRLQTAMIPWDAEASLRIPVALWREAVDSAFPGSAWMRVDRELFARLHERRARGGFATWDQLLEALLKEGES